MVFAPYTRRIDKHTSVNGKVFFRVLYFHVGWWNFLTSKKFKTFGDAVVWVRKYDLQQIEKTKTISEF